MPDNLTLVLPVQSREQRKESEFYDEGTWIQSLSILNI